MRFPSLRSLPLSILLLLFSSAASAAGPALPKALADAPAVSSALNNVLEIAKTGSRTRWDAPSGRHGFITINRTWFPKPDQPCREYLRSMVNPGGKPILMHGTGCRDNNGLWMLLESQRGAVSTSSDCPPATAVATPLPSTRIRPSVTRSPATSSGRSKPSSSSRSGPGSSAVSSKTSAKAAPKPSSKATTTRSTKTASSAKTSRSSKPASPPAPTIDPAAAAIIDASQPTPAEW